MKIFDFEKEKKRRRVKTAQPKTTTSSQTSGMSLAEFITCLKGAAFETEQAKRSWWAKTND